MRFAVRTRGVAPRRVTMVRRWQRGLKRAGLTIRTGRTVDDSCRRTLQLALPAAPSAGASELGDRSVLAPLARACGVWGSAPLGSALPALSLVHTYELSRPSRDWCARSTA